MWVLTDMTFTGGLAVVAAAIFARERRRRAVRRELDDYLQWLLPRAVHISEQS